MGDPTSSRQRDRLRYLPWAVTSALLVVVLYASVRLGIGRTPYRSVEILIVPCLTLLFMAPALALANIVPAEAYTWLSASESNRRFQRLWSVVLVVGMLLVMWFVFGDALQTQWGMIDDQEIMSFLVPDGKLDLGEIPAMLMRTEVGAWGHYPRFRPAYFFLRMLETAFWGKDPTLWYGCRLAIIAAGVLAFWKLASPRMGKLGAALLCLYTLSFPYWVEYVGRLGPSETYVVVGLPMYLAGVLVALRSEPSRAAMRALACAAILIGSMVCIGSKENLLILALPSAYLMIKAARGKDWLLLGAAVGSLLFVAYVAGGILLSASKTGLDIYDRPVALASRLAVILDVLRGRHYVTPFSMLITLTVGVAALSLIPALTQPQRRAVHSAAFWLACLCGVYLSQMVFYNGRWPETETRYGYPGLLYFPASIFILYGLGRDLLASSPSASRLHVALKASLSISLVLVIGFHGSYSGTRETLRGNVASTREFTARFERLVDQLRQDEDLQVVIESSDILDYEPVFGYPRFLSAYQVRNPLFLRVSGYGPDSFQPGLFRRLAEELMVISAYGDDVYLPLASLDERPDRCLSIYLTSEYPTACTAFR